MSDRRDLLVAVTRDDASGLIVSYLAEGGRLVGMRLVLPLAVVVLAVSCGWAAAYLGVSLSLE